MNKDGQVARLFGFDIDALSQDQVLEIVDHAICGEKQLRIGVVNAAKIVKMRGDAELRDDVLASDLVLADGMSVVWASRLLGRPLPERVAGIDLMMSLLARGNTSGYRFYCLGATEEVSRMVADRIRNEFPGIVLAGRHHGYFTADEEATLVADIRNSKADILLVAMTSPRKERFIAKWCNEMGVRVLHGVGGSFDVYSGKIQRAPITWQSSGFEWLYRVLQEPGRLWRRYLVTNTKFCGLVIRELLTRRPA